MRSELSDLDDLLPAAQALAVAARENDAEACFLLAALYDGKSGFPRDSRQSRALLEQACALGFEPACAQLRESAPK
ncbi:MAG TPA: SEL1-like repeat protein [Planctomycetota bacterium]|nr:SEL1-like repeat protein [Planctomycetota bacterium]